MEFHNPFVVCQAHVGHVNSITARRVLLHPQVSFGMPDDEPKSLSPEPKKSVSFTSPHQAAASGNSFLNKIGSILTREPTPPVCS